MKKKRAVDTYILHSQSAFIFLLLFLSGLLFIECARQKATPDISTDILYQEGMALLHQYQYDLSLEDLEKAIRNLCQLWIL